MDVVKRAPKEKHRFKERVMEAIQQIKKNLGVLFSELHQ